MAELTFLEGTRVMSCHWFLVMKREEVSHEPLSLPFLVVEAL